MTSHTVGELLEAWQTGDASAFTRLVERFESSLLRYARFLPCGADGAEDVVQEAFLRLARRPPRLPPEVEGDPRLQQAHLASWLFRVTRNCAMELVRSDSRRRQRERHSAAAEVIEEGHCPLVENDTRAAVEEGLRRLPDDQREVLVLRLLGDRSYREIAEITGRKPGTVAWLIAEGLRALSGRLAASFDLAPAAIRSHHHHGGSAR